MQSRLFKLGGMLWSIPIEIPLLFAFHELAMNRSFRLPRPSRPHVLIALPLAGLLLFGAWQLVAAQSGPAKRPAPAPVPVLLTQVKKQDLVEYLSGIGTVQATASVTVRARVDGQLQSVAFREGQEVKAGDLLAQIDPRALQAQLEQVQAQKQKDEASLANARLDLQRYEDLVKLDASTRQTLDTQKALVAQLTAAVRADRAQVDYAAVQLGYTRITAPVSGRTGVRLVDAGNLVRAAEATGIVVVNQIDPISLVFTLPEEQVARIRAAALAGGKSNKGESALTVQAYSRDGNEPLAQGRLLLVNNQIDSGSGTVQLKASFPNKAEKLWPGQFAQVRLLLGQQADALVVPASAVQRGPEGTFVYTVKADQTVAVRKVEVGRLQDGQAVIAKGVQEGETLVAEGQGRLRPGMAVAAIGQNSPGEAGPKGKHRERGEKS